MVWTHPFVIIAARCGATKFNHHTWWTEAQRNQFAAQQPQTWSGLLTNYTRFGLLISKTKPTIDLRKTNGVGGKINSFTEHFLSKWSGINFSACNLMNFLPLSLIKETENKFKNHSQFCASCSPRCNYKCQRHRKQPLKGQLTPKSKYFSSYLLC